MKTAVDFLVQELRNGKVFNDKLIEQAKEMEKQQKGYSEEDVYKLIYDYQDYLFWTNYPVNTFKEWFEQNKKKQL
jgi:hypothetical protein